MTVKELRERLQRMPDSYVVYVVDPGDREWMNEIKDIYGQHNLAGQYWIEIETGNKDVLKGEANYSRESDEGESPSNL